MIIAIDIGNSFIKWKAWSADGLVVEAGRGTHEQGVEVLLSHLSRQSPRCVAIANVANHAIEESIQDLFADVPLRSIKSTAQCLGVSNAYTQPERLGVDRWLALIEAYHLAAGNAVCVADLGTAATLDVADAQGVHQGGYIVPGLSLMRRSLQQSTSRVRVGADEYRRGYGVNTTQAVEAGTEAMMTGWLMRELMLFRDNYPEGAIYLTGGDALQMAPLLTVNAINVCEDLVLDGLRRVATR